ncbi:TonB-dependent receptor plug domain-containing protein [Bacteroidales bacterium OttesenSCG-928-B11]|nr:TonB-dependent receptor plug domain-containing protein [Bacteroidales bacterium OttesenSCG-928-C03]MDL2311371.1 TonB-dependent receptor plug domain-containing protein [Bacteroidales bacterium OttesenSCG-928-B11]MDL2326015.1 TonB-dependent receptor plug domain-containing protein [Bacteroidales bacterium OttesenSCG-928-A14]
MNRAALITIILLATVFRVTAQEQYGILSGSITNPQSIPLDHVIIENEELSIKVFTDLKGKFTLKLPANQKVRLNIYRDFLHADTAITVTLAPGEKREIVLALQYNITILTPAIVTPDIRSHYVPINPNITYQVPTPTGDIISLLKTMGGVYSTDELSSQYNVRGGNFDENLIYVNDIEIHRPFLVRSSQQEGLSFINPDLTKSVKFSAGGFEAKYGDKMSSVLDVEYKKPELGYRSSATASFLGATAHTEGNIANKFTYLIGIRYKSNAYLLKSLDTKGDYKPRFFDTQMLLNWNINTKWSVELLGNITRNTYLFTPTSRVTSFGGIFNPKQLVIDYEGQEVDKYANYLGALTFHFKPSPKNRYKLILSSYHAKESETYDILASYRLEDIEADLGNEGSSIINVVGVSGIGSFLEHARNNITAVVSNADFRGYHRLKKHHVDWGIKFQHEYIDDKLKQWYMKDSSGYVLPNPSGTPGDSVAWDDPSRDLIINPDDYISAINTLNTIRFSGFIQDTWNIGDSSRFSLNYGIRYTFWSYTKELNISPRVQFTYNPRWKKHDWVFHLRGGCYHQSPFYREMRNKYGELNPNIKSQRSYQAVAVAEYAFELWERPFKFTTEAYYKYLDRLISYTVDNVKIIYSGKNDAKGYATGLDLRLSGEFIHGLESWISLSIMKTAENIEGDYIENNDGVLEEVGYLPRPTDQRFAINIFFQDHFPKMENFRVHLNFIFASGTPYSIPNQERKSGLQTDRNGKTTFSRTSWYRRVDIGFSYRLLANDRDRNKNKSNFIKTINEVNIYFEVFNLIGTSNIASHTWVSDISSQMIPVPNYLTGRLINLKFAISI